MPEETILRCDVSGCTEIGERCYVTLKDGKRYEVILGPEHHHLVERLAEWGRPAKSAPVPRTKRRDTSPARLLKLIDADKPK